MTDRRKDGRGTRCHAAALWLVLLAVVPSFPLSAQDSLPAGYGTLKRDDIAVRLSTDQLEIQVLPLREGVIRLLAPDTYRSLSDLIHTRQAAIDSLSQRAAVPHPSLVLATFYGLVPQARFSPEELNLTSGGKLFRPLGIVPVSPRWNSYQLDAREQAAAIYLFEDGITFREDVTVSYQSLSSNSWSRSLRALDEERARVRARAGMRSSPSPSPSPP